MTSVKTRHISRRQCLGFFFCISLPSQDVFPDLFEEEDDEPELPGAQSLRMRTRRQALSLPVQDTSSQDTPHKFTLRKATGDGNAAENKVLEAKDALATFKTALGDKVSDKEFDTVGLLFAGIARRRRSCGSSTRPCGSPSGPGSA